MPLQKRRMVELLFVALYLFCCIPSCSDNPNSIVYSASSCNIYAVSQPLCIYRPASPFCSVEELRWHGRCFHATWGCVAIIFSPSGVIGLLFRNFEESAQRNHRIMSTGKSQAEMCQLLFRDSKVKCISKHFAVNVCPGPDNLQI